MRGKFLWLCWVLGAAPLFGCTTRTTPLPPPIVDSVSAANDAGRVTVTGLALENASVGVVNQRTLEGTIATSHDKDCDSACEFTAELAAESGDSLWVWQFFDVGGGLEAEVPKQ